MSVRIFLWVLIFQIAFCIPYGGMRCTQDQECPSLHYCKVHEESHYATCVHKEFWPPTLFEMLSMIIIMTGAALCCTVGVGGGVIFVPTFISIL